MKIVKRIVCIALTLSMAQAVSMSSYVSAGTTVSAATTTSTTTAKTTKITLSKTTAKLVQGKTITLKATVSPNTSAKITWTSSNKKVVTVDSNGKVKAVAKGIANVTAKTSDGQTAVCLVTVITKNEAYIEDVIKLTNQERTRNGLSKLTVNSRLASAAQKRATETSQKLSHTRPNGQSCFTVLKDYNIKYTVAGENIAYNYYTAAEAMEGWMDSPGHKANILNPKFKNIGVGLYEKDGVKYCVQLFI